MAHARRDLSLGALLAVVSPDNAPSARLLEKLGFRFERAMPFGDEGREVRLFVLD